jgi:hypothetical protein
MRSAATSSAARLNVCRPPFDDEWRNADEDERHDDRAWRGWWRPPATRGVSHERDHEGESLAGVPRQRRRRDTPLGGKLLLIGY